MQLYELDISILGRAPLVALRGRAAAVEARRVVAAIRLETVEHDRIALERLDAQAFLGAVGPPGSLGLAVCVGEDRLAALLDRGEVHQDRHHALPAALRCRVDRIVEVVIVLAQ